MKKRTSFDMEIGSNVDLSLLRKPLTPFTGFNEAKSAFEKGTAEVRHLLLHECSLIYECNVCRNMFRSLANFISHKRVFCCKSALERNDSHDSTNFTETRKSSAAREYLPPKNSSELHQKNTQVQNNEADEVANAKKTRCLNIDVNQEANKAEREENALASPKKSHSIDLNETGNQPKVEQVADQSSSSYVFQCPSCSLTFLKSSSVIRHLASAHNIPMRRIRMMRDTITKRPAESVLLNGETAALTTKSKANRELKNLQMSVETISTSTSATTTNDGCQNPNIKPIDEDLTKCIFCQKSFDRRATLSAHLQTCHIKMEMLEDTTMNTGSKRMRLQSNVSSTPQKQTMAAVAADVDCAALNEEDEDVKRTFAHLEQQDFGAGLQTVSLDKLDISAGESTNASMVIEKETDAEPHSTSTELTKTDEDLKIKIDTDLTLSDGNIDSSAGPSSLSASAKKRKQRTNCVLKQSCRCKICGKQFNALSNLRRHISMFHYRSRKFGCKLCDYCAFRRYDIINHLGFVHKMSGEDNPETAKLVRVNDVPYTKDDMEEDIVLLGSSGTTDNNADDEYQSTSNGDQTMNEPVVAQPEKRRRRRNKNLVSQLEKQFALKTTDTFTESCVEMKLTRQTLKRSLSANSANSSMEIVYTSTTKSNQKRPTRNRVKMVNKDFVYDLNDVKKEQAQAAAPATVETEAYHLRGSKRRNTLNAMQVELKQPTVPAFEIIKPKIYATIKGAARRSCLLLVNMGLAASSTLPEIPSERPQMRSRLVSMQRSDSQAGTVIESSEIDAARLKSLPLCDDSYLEKITKESVGSFEMRPCLAPQQHSALDELLLKVDSSKNFFLNGGNARLTASSNQVRKEINEVAAQTNYLDAATTFEDATALTPASPYYITPQEAISKTFVTPPKPQKRLPSLDRLTETINSTVDSYYNAPPFEH